MPRHDSRSRALSRQRTLFGVDMLERQVADLTSLVFSLLENNVSRETLLVTVHAHRAGGWLIQYTDRQRSDFEFGGGDDGKES